MNLAIYSGLLYLSKHKWYNEQGEIRKQQFVMNFKKEFIIDKQHRRQSAKYVDRYLNFQCIGR